MVSDIERERVKYQMKEKEVFALQSRLDREKEYYTKKFNNLEQEIQTSRDTCQQQLESERSTHEIEIETKRFEIDSLKRQLSLQNSESAGSRLDWEELRRQLARKDADITRRSAENKELKLELKVSKTDLQCSKIEYQLAAYKNNGTASFGKEHSSKIRELSQMLQKLRKESESMKNEQKLKGSSS